MARFRFSAAYSDKSTLAAAIEQVTKTVQAELGEPLGFALLFTSGYASAECEDRFSSVADRLGTHCVIGCNSESVVFANQEIEGEKCVTLLASSFVLENSTNDPKAFHLQYENHDASFTGFPSDWPEESQLIVLADPVSFPVDIFLHWVQKNHPDTQIVGGVCSAVFGNESFVGNPLENSLSVLACGNGVFREGAVCLRIPKALTIHSVVSQGCRPIGEPMVVTDCERNEIFSLGGKKPIEKLREVFSSSPTRDQRAFDGLQLGIAMTEYKDKFAFGDFLVRDLTSIDDGTGHLAVSDFLRKGQTVQFHLRDEHSADAELSQLLSGLAGRTNTPLAGFLVTCNSRGMNLFPNPHHDAGLFRDKIGEIPVTGFFAAGEIGPIANSNYLHNMACVAIVFDEG